MLEFFLDKHRGFILALRNQGKTATWVKEEFERTFNLKISKSSVIRFTYPCINKKKERSGRPPKLKLDIDKTKALKIIKRNGRKSWKQLADLISRKTRINLGFTTVRRFCKLNKINNYKIQKKPKITKTVAQNRLNFAMRFKNKRPSFWQKLYYSDEKTFTRTGKFEAGNNWIKCLKEDKFKPQNCINTVKFDFKGIKYSGGISFFGPGILYKMEEKKMNSKVYKNILEKAIMPSMRNLGLEFLLHDWDTSHDSEETNKFIKMKKINVFRDFPSNSPDINVVENVWALIQSRVRRKNPSSLNIMHNMITEEWENLDLEYLQSLINSIPKRIDNIIKNKGYFSKY